MTATFRPDHETWLEREIRSQGQALRERSGRGAIAAAQAADRLADGVDYLLIAARGSSDNAARFGQYLFGAELRLTVALAAPSLYSAAEHAPRIGAGAALAISQSGRSPDVVGVLVAARAQGRPAIALTNDESSPLARSADVVVPLAVGAERSVAATKTYTASLHALAQIAAALHRGGPLTADLDAVPHLVELIAAEELADRRRLAPLGELERIVVVGRGLAYAAAHETALKLRELSGIPAEAFSPPDLLHGPVAALDRRTALWVIAPSPGAAAEAAPLVDDLRRRSGPLVIVSPDRVLLELADVPVGLPTDLSDWVAAFLAVLPGQAAALQLAEQRGVQVDLPHGLSKLTLTS